MLRLPIVATPSQSMRVSLGGQQCEIQIDQKYHGGVFMSLKANDVQVVNFAICRDRVSIARKGYLPFVGTLSFIDTQGASDPDYTGFGTRYQLAYIP
jgi:hypothetical protein